MQAVPDDGIVDVVAVRRFLDGHTVPLTRPEMLVVIARLASEGVSDLDIAARFGRPDLSGKGWIQHIRKRHGIQHVETYSDAALWRLLVFPEEVARASEGRRRAAGLVERMVAA